MCSLSAFHTKHAIMLNLFCYQGQVWGCTCAFHTSHAYLTFFFLCQGKNTSSGCTFNKLATMLVYVIFFSMFLYNKESFMTNWQLIAVKRLWWRVCVIIGIINNVYQSFDLWGKKPWLNHVELLGTIRFFCWSFCLVLFLLS